MVKMNEMNVEERMNMLKLSAEYGQGAKTAAGVQANGRDASEKIQLDMAEEIGKEFARAFYNSLATKPAEAFKFYSHESFALLDDGRRYVGQAEIGREIEKRYFEQLTRFQIYSIKSVPSASGGIVVVVCGKRNDSPFVETFVLAQQTAKKFYVFSNIFQLVDETFDESRRTAAMMQKTEAVQQAAQLPASHNYGQNIMEKITAQNGHGHTPTTPVAGHVDEKPKSDDHHRGSADKPLHHATTPQKNEPPRKKTNSHSEHHQALKSEHEQSSALIPPVAATQPQEPPKPRTWANIAEGTNPKQPSNQIAQPQVQHHTTPTNNMSSAAHTQPGDRDGGRGGSFGGRGRGGYRGRGGGFRSGEREGGNYRGGEHRGGDREGGGRGGFRGGPRGGGGSSRGDRDNHNRDGGYSGGRGGGARDGNHRGGGGFNRDGGHRGGRGGGAAAAGGNEQR